MKVIRLPFGNMGELDHTCYRSALKDLNIHTYHEVGTDIILSEVRVISRAIR